MVFKDCFLSSLGNNAAEGTQQTTDKPWTSEEQRVRNGCVNLSLDE